MTGKIIIENNFKIEKIKEDSLDSISSPSPSVKIQIMGCKISLSCKGKILLGIVNNLLKKFVDITPQCFALLRQGNFPVHNLNFY